MTAGLWYEGKVTPHMMGERLIFIACNLVGHASQNLQIFGWFLAWFLAWQAASKPESLVGS